MKIQVTKVTFVNCEKCFDSGEVQLSFYNDSELYMTCDCVIKKYASIDKTRMERMSSMR